MPAFCELAHLRACAVMGESAGHRRDATCCFGKGSARRPARRRGQGGARGRLRLVRPRRRRARREADPARAPAAAGLSACRAGRCACASAAWCWRCEADRPTPALDPPPALRPFLVARGGDIRLRYRERPAARRPPGERLFDSGGVWRVERSRGRLVYRFRIPNRRPPHYKAVVIDAALRRGTLALRSRPAAARTSRSTTRSTSCCSSTGSPATAPSRCTAAASCGGAARCSSAAARAPASRPPRGSGGGTRAARGCSRTTGWSCAPADARCASYGTPWHGDGGFASPRRAPRSARSSSCATAGPRRLRPLPRAEAAARLFTRSFPPPWDREGVARALDACADAAARAPAFELAFRPRTRGGRGRAARSWPEVALYCLCHQ